LSRPIGAEDQGGGHLTPVSQEVIHILLFQRRFWWMDDPSEHFIIVRFLFWVWSCAYYYPALSGAGDWGGGSMPAGYSLLSDGESRRGFDEIET